MRSTSAIPRVLEAVRSAVATAPPLPWGVAYSGGRDSGVLLWALCQVVDPGQLTALYVDHGWRPPEERAREADLVGRWCSTLGVALQRFDPPPPGPRSEASARDHRYACFRSFLAQAPAQAIFLGHHADDQAETVLMRLLQGRSWQGLAGMSPRRGPYRRPLLDLRSSLLAQVALEVGVPFHTDSTNLDLSPSRNFLRQLVVPQLLERFPRTVEALGEFSRVWSQQAPRGERSPAWTLETSSATVPGLVWDGWSGLERQAQLLAVATGLGQSRRLGRRFLEQIAAGGDHFEGAGWRWSRRNGLVRWERLVRDRVTEYFVLAEPGREYDVSDYSFCWTAEDPGGAWHVPGPDATQPLVWRSASPGLVFSSIDDPDWGKQRRRRLLGATAAGRCVVLQQAGVLKAVVDPVAKRVLWSETGLEKLHKPGIFVKLRERSDYERR